MHTVHNFTIIALCIDDLRHFVPNGPILQTLEANLSQLGMEYEISDRSVMTVEILCTDFCDFRIKEGGVSSN